MDDFEEQFYEQAATELAMKCPKSGIMAKAFSKCEGDEKKSYALYIKLRVQQLREEYERELNRKKAEERLERVRKKEEIKNRDAMLKKLYRGG